MESERSRGRVVPGPPFVAIHLRLRSPILTFVKGSRNARPRDMLNLHKVSVPDCEDDAAEVGLELGSSAELEGPALFAKAACIVVSIVVRRPETADCTNWFTSVCRAATVDDAVLGAV